MKHNLSEILELLGTVTDDPQGAYDAWALNKANVPLDLSKYHYPLFLYSFPIELEGKTLATVTLAQFSCTGLDNQRQPLMCKYLTPDKYLSSWFAYSHDTYLDCYLTVEEEFDIPEGGIRGTYVDAEGVQFAYRLYQRGDGDYSNPDYYFDCGLYMDIDKISNGWSMGEKINEVISNRVK